MALKNTYSRGNNTFDKIQRVLATHGANKIMYDYGTDGRLIAITFGMTIEGNTLGFRLPANINKVEQIMYGDRSLTEAQSEQAYKTGWANIRDWIDAQMALVETQQAELTQVFLPYAVQQNGKTLYENIVSNPHLLLGEGSK